MRPSQSTGAQTCQKTARLGHAATGLLIPGLPAQGFVQEHLDVGLVADALLRGHGARHVNIGGRQPQRDRPRPGASCGFAQGERGSLQDAPFCGPLKRRAVALVPLGVFRFRRESEE